MVRLAACVGLSFALAALAWTNAEHGIQAGIAAAQPGQPPRSELLPGLLLTAVNGDFPNAPLHVSIVPTVGVYLGEDESPHPALAPDPLILRWQGRLRVVRGDEYRFGAWLRGKLRIVVSGREVLAGEVKEGRAQWIEGPPLATVPGDHPIFIEFFRLPGAARVQLWWSAKHFHREPVPHTALGRQPDQAAKQEQVLADARRDRGQFLAEEHGCAACHRPTANDSVAMRLRNVSGPNLGDVGSRIKEPWLHHWLRDPKATRTHSLMPKLFADDEMGWAGAYAVAKFLASLGGPYREPADKANPNDRRTSIARGERLFNTVGCTVCHTGPKDRQAEASSKVPLAGLSGKTGPASLARFLQDPLAVHPSGRMPNMLLTPTEAADLSRFLCEEAASWKDPTPPPLVLAQRILDELGTNEMERAAFAKLPEADRWLTVGRRLTVEKGCTNCHSIDIKGQAVERKPARSDFTSIRRQAAHAKGCLAAKPAGNAPRFWLSEPDRLALQEFLAGPILPKAAAAPIHDARLAMHRFQCLSCHEKDGTGGLAADAVEALRRLENAENAEAVVPPPLTGVGEKLQSAWMRKVLAEKGRARPWMALRMPQFGSANVGRLHEGLAALDGADPADRGAVPPFSTESVSVGRQLVGKKTFGCIACHDIAGNPAAGTRGPDLAYMQDRVRYDWYRRWLEQPQRMQAGTRMPTIFPDGKSLIDDVLGGRADAQAAAMWTYLSLGPSLPLPEGTEPPPGLTLIPKDRPMVLRTFMPEAGAKAIAVGFPDQVSAAFDAATCRLVYAWAGNFLDASPVWNNRGGAPAKVLGARFFTAPDGFPWAFTAPDGTPDFAAQAGDPAYGAKVPEGQLFTGAPRLRFIGYLLAKDGSPIFEYEVAVRRDERVEIRERITADRRDAAVGIARGSPGVSNWPSRQTQRPGCEWGRATARRGCWTLPAPP